MVTFQQLSISNRWFSPTLSSITFIHRLPGLSSVLLVSSSMVFRRGGGETVAGEDSIWYMVNGLSLIGWCRYLNAVAKVSDA